MRADRWALVAALWMGCRATPYRCDPAHVCGATAVCAADGYCAERVSATTCPSGLRYTQSAANPGGCAPAGDAQTPTDATIDAVADSVADAPGEAATDARADVPMGADVADDAMVDALVDVTVDAAMDARNDAVEDVRSDASDGADVPVDAAPCTEVARAIRPLSGSRMSGTMAQLVVLSRAPSVEAELSTTPAFTAATTVTFRGSGPRYEATTSTLMRGAYFWRVRARCMDGGAGAWSPTWSFQMAGRPEGMGTVIGWVHDLNGDGRGDLAVGTPTVSTSDREGGKVEVFPSGPMRPLTRTPGSYWTVTSASVATAFTAPLFGDQVAIVPDMNGDGLAELAVGACEFSPAATCTPVVAVFRGARDPATPLVLLGAVRQSDEPLQRFGVTLAGVGDVTGDGYGDLVIGDPGLFGRGVGRLFLVAGGAIGLAPEMVRARMDEIPDAGHGMTLFGRQVAGPGDVNGDQLPDIVVASFQQAWVISGGAISDFATAPLVRVEIYGDDEGTYGLRASGAGDMNGDGLADFALARPGQRANTGDVSIFAGTNAITGRWTTALTTVSGESIDGRFGLAIAGGGDVNNDQRDDLLVGAPSDSGGLGAVRYISGTSLATSFPIMRGLSGVTAFGRSVAFVGDLNHDGLEEVAAGVSMPRFGAVELFTAPAARGDAPTVSGSLTDEASASYGLALSHP